MSKLSLNKYLNNFLNFNKNKFIFCDYYSGLDKKKAHNIINKLISSFGTKSKKGFGIGIYLPRNVYVKMYGYNIL